MLRDLALCERRVHHDLHSDAAQRDAVSDFVKMLWAGGIAHESTVLGSLPGTVIDLRKIPLDARHAATIAALDGAADWIVGARLEIADLLGMPDLLHRVNGRWHAGDIKAGTPFAADGERPKSEYSVQIGLYSLILGLLGAGADDRAFIIGGDGKLVWYDLDAPSGRGGLSIRDRVGLLVSVASAVRDRLLDTRGALSAACGLCHWRTMCTAELIASDDLTQVAGLGRALRDTMTDAVPTVAALAALDTAAMTLPGGRTTIAGIGVTRLERFRDRAVLLSTPGATPYARTELGLGRVDRELHFDIEADPMRNGLVYLHGVIERTRHADGDRERFVYFFADGQNGERDAFAAAFAFLTEDPDAKIYYYSKFERSAYRALQARHPTVCTADDIERLFDPKRAIDLLFDIVMPSTEWPTRNLSIKTLAKFCGFAWRDTDASGAASIAWYDQYESTGDEAVRNRIIEYNCDDCVATRVLLDALIALPVRPASPTKAISGPSSDEPLF